MRDRYQLVDTVVALGQGAFQLLDDAAMGRFAITEFDFELVDAVLCRVELFDLGAESITVGQTLVELRDVVAEDTDLFLQDLTSLFSALRGLVGGSQVFGLGLGLSIKYTDPLIALGQGALQL